MNALVNGLVNKMITFKFIGSDVKVICVKFNDANAMKVAIQQDHLARQNNWVSTKKVESSFPINKNNISLHQTNSIPIYATVSMPC